MSKNGHGRFRGLAENNGAETRSYRERNSEMTTASTRIAEARSKRTSGLLVSLALGVALAGVVGIAGVAQRAEAAFPDKVVFVSDRTKGTGVNNPTGDEEIFTMNPDGTGIKQLTFNEVNDDDPTFSPDGTKVVYESEGIQNTNPEGDEEVYIVNARDGSNNKNLTNNGVEVSGGNARRLLPELLP